MVIALPGARGLFSHLQQALSTTSRRANPSHPTHPCHHSRFYMAGNQLAQRPTRLRELVETPPYLLAPQMHVAMALGGVLLPPTATDATLSSGATPCPPELAKNLCTIDNPSGTLSINALELSRHTIPT